VSVTCSNGHENLDGMTFCEDCGVELTAITNAPLTPPIPDPSAETPPAPMTSQGLGSTAIPASVPLAVDPSIPIAGLAPVQTLVPETPPLATAPAPFAPQTPSAAGGPASVGSAYLEITSGPFVGRRFPVTEPVCLIGRWDVDSAAFPQIDLTDVDTDAKISRKHARITRDTDGFKLEDLGSLNGTSHAGSARMIPGDPRVLSDGDTVIMGRLFMRFGTK
jgi:FHA domain